MKEPGKGKAQMKKKKMEISCLPRIIQELKKNKKKKKKERKGGGWSLLFMAN